VTAVVCAAGAVRRADKDHGDGSVFNECGRADPQDRRSFGSVASDGVEHAQDVLTFDIRQGALPRAGRTGRFPQLAGSY
jgi:hypothetical protein